MEMHPVPQVPEKTFQHNDLFDIAFEQKIAKHIEFSLERKVAIVDGLKEVTFELYLTSLSPYGTIYSDYEKYGYLEFDDELVSFSARKLMALRPAERKLLFSHTRTYTTDVVAVRVKGCVRAAVTLDGYYVNQMSLGGVMIIKDPS